MLILITSALQMRMDKVYIPPHEEEVDSKTTVFEDGGVQNISRIKINRTLIILMFLCIRQEKTPKGCKKKKNLLKRTTNFQEKRFISKELRIRTQKKFPQLV